MSEKNSSTVFNKNSEERRRKQSRVLLVGLIAVLVLVGIIMGILRRPQFQIQTITVRDVVAMDPDRLSTYTKDILSGYYAWVIPKTSVFFISKTALEKKIVQHFSNIEKVRVDFHDTQELIITATEKKPSYVWCKETSCYFVDDQGVLFKESPLFDDGVYITILGGSVSLENPLRSRFVEESMFQTLKNLVEQLQARNIVITRVEYFETGDVGLTLYKMGDYFLGKQTQLLVQSSARWENIIETLQLLREDTAFKESLLTKSVALEVIDLRFEGKIYYKFNE